MAQSLAFQRLCGLCLWNRAYNSAYVRLNPVKAGLIKRAEDRPWSSVHDYIGSLSTEVSADRILAVDYVLFPADERARI